MNNSSHEAFVETKEYRRFVEFCQACSDARYIGLCYGPPGVGKTLSAWHYATWDKVESLKPPYSPHRLKDIVGANVVLYTPKVVNSPGHIDRDIAELRRKIENFIVEDIIRTYEPLLDDAEKRRDEASREYFLGPRRANSRRNLREFVNGSEKINNRCQRQLDRTKDPTVLIVIDETDRLKVAGLEQVRAIFDGGGIGLVLIGMPGLEKRLARLPQLYSRVGFVHEFRTLAESETRKLLQQGWSPPGFKSPEGGYSEEVLAAILRITGGNFRLLDRLLTQVGRILEINQLQEVTREVVEAARESLVIGTV